jgi:lipopolysaccharide transport protein LptA
VKTLRRQPAVRTFIASWLAALGWLAAAGPALGQAAPPTTNVSIGVASFERVGDVAAEVPDVSLLLARRLSTLGVARVASPSDLGGSAAADPDAKTAAALATRGGVAALVVGRTTALGGKLSIDARLRNGRTGEPIGRRFFVEVPKPRDLSSAVDQLADQVLAQVRALPASETAVAAPPPLRAAAPAAAAPSAPSAPKPAAPAAAPADEAPAPRAKGGAIAADAPITIKSDVLDVFEEGGKRRFVFAGNVRANQADLKIRATRLEAFYAANASEPERIVASGDVTMSQAGRTARCTQATFYRKADRIVCIGDVAEVEQGCDVVRGKEIEFFTASQKLKVHDVADVRIAPDSACSKGSAGSGQ